MDNRLVFAADPPRARNPALHPAPAAPAADLPRLVAFNALLAEVNRIAACADEAGLLQATCELSVRSGSLGLVWVGRPDSQGDLHVVAAAGLTGYLQGLEVSVKRDRPEGQGPAGLAWRQGIPQYVASIADEPLTGPWRKRAAEIGLTGIVSMRLQRGGERWGILTFYLTAGGEFGPDIRLLLEEVARTVSAGLDRLDAQARERALITTQRLLLEHTHAGISMGRERSVIVANRHLAEMLGYDRPEDLLGHSARILYASDAEYERVGDAYRDLYRDGVRHVTDVHLQRRDRRIVVADVTLSLVRDPDGDTIVWTAQDVTERFVLEQELEHQAYHDTLTGLPNRRALDLELPRTVERARRDGTDLVLGMLDLDDFKTVNDMLGHEAGDRVLRDFAGRLRKVLGRRTFVARPGGDEFVILFEAPEPLEEVLQRLHRVVEEPFEPASGKRFAMEISLGLAAFPDDGIYGEQLLRTADGALYELKAQKQKRSQWWQLASRHSAMVSDAQAEVDAYDDRAVALLGDIQGLLADVAQESVDTLFLQLATDSAAAPVLADQGPDGIDKLKRSQAESLRFLFAPTTAQAEVAARARQLGEIHQLAGIDPALLMRAVALYRSLVADHLRETLLSARTRYQVMRVVEQRLQDHMENDLQGMQAVIAAYAGLLSSSLPHPQPRWVDVSRHECETLGRLPGVAGVLLLRLDPDGVFTVEHRAGQVADQIGGAPIEQIQQGSPPGTVVADIAKALLDDSTLTVADCMTDKRFAPWSHRIRRIGVRSLQVIPVRDGSGHAGLGLCILGRYPHQFESPLMHEFSQSMAHRWEDVWQRSSAQAGTAVVSHEIASAYRQHLAGDGLRMFVQPVVDLRAGQVVKVEALARLVLPDGRIVPPSVFLPLLGRADMARLFRSGLDQALGYVRAWESQGIQLGVAVNLEPATLLLPECAQWVEQALTRHALAPDRLTIELLESQQVDERERDVAIERLVGVGVRLAIDDLGSGFSSLKRLSTLPFHTIKIDQGLVRRLRDEPIVTLVVLNTLMEMGRHLGRDVVVEGLEDPDAIEVAALLGAPFGQGYGLARPMPAADFMPWMAEFTLPIEPGAAHTYLGALAHHWKHGHTMPMEDCPLTHLLDEQGLFDSVAAQWHQRAHGQEGTKAATALTSWLLEHVR